MRDFLITMILSASVITGCSLKAISNSPCVQPGIPIDPVSSLLRIPTEEGTAGLIYLGHQRTKGTLYLMSCRTGNTLVKINENWWFNTLIYFTSINIDSDHQQEIEVAATYYTGVGPTGAYPFSHTTILKYANNQWSAIRD